MLKIRLMRIGAKKIPFYRVVVVDERAKRTGAYIEAVGTYNPLTEPKDIKLKQDRIDHWVKQGAQMSVGFLRIIGKAPQRPPRKPKKEKKEEQPAAVQPAEAKSDLAEVKAEEPQAPAETPAAATPTEEPAKEETTQPQAESEPAKANTSDVKPEVKSEENTSEVPAQSADGSLNDSQGSEEKPEESKK